MRTIGTILLIAISLAVFGQSKFYPLDDSHSQVKFIGHLGGMMDVEGTFGAINGYMRFDENDLSQTSITLSIDPASVASGNEWRDKHLKNPYFLDIEQFPDLIFQSKAVKPEGKFLMVTGDLTLKGQTREMVIPMELAYPPTPDPWGNRRIGFNGKMDFLRSEVKIGPTEGFWSNSIADEFEMEFVISVVQQNMDRMSVFNRSPMKEIYEAAEEGKTSSVKEQLQPLIESGKVQSGIVNQIGLRLDQHEKPNEALKIYQLTTELFSDDNNAYSNLARAFMDRGKLAKAKENAKKALELDPKDVLAMEILK